MEEPTILFEDDMLVVVNKPSGMIVYPDGKHDYPALSHWLDKKYQEHHFVHRIDRETSGVLVVAKTAEAHAFLKEQFQNREIKKIYRAFVYGALKEERGVIERPIGSARGGRGPRSATRPHGVQRAASTTWKRLSNTSTEQSASGQGAAYIEAFPKTGRTHQIRVHCAAIQHPIVCDQLYAPQRPPMFGFKRLALHAYSITIAHPSGREMTFLAPLPPDFVAAEAELRKA
ncbi:RluA family pseudouridine synthase [Candidatus Kaiserbacteria bacterium]|nr:RluA family pseudouridine synthase [Candidatus Kaiserbacteria bacterium]